MNNMTRIKELPFDERPREKLLKYGVNQLSNSELIAILIGSGTKDSSAIMLASKLLAVDDLGIAYLADCTPEELRNIKGIGGTKASRLISAVELGKRIAAKPKVKKLHANSPRDVSNMFMEDMRHLKKEYFKVVLLNTKNELIATEDISVGSLNSAIVHPREVFSRAVRKSASSMIFVHNHPSGNPEPSKEDIDLTSRLIESGKILGIEVLDHIIIGDGIFVSLKERMLM
jgi:DNA repair protein RadC